MITEWVVRGLADASERSRQFLHSTYRGFDPHLYYLRKEAAGPRGSVSLARRLWLWRKGFLSRADYQYDFETYSPEQYLSDFQKHRARRINRGWDELLANKLAFDRLMRPFEDHRMTVYGVVSEGRYVPVDSGESQKPQRRLGGDATVETANGGVRTETGPEPVRELLERDGRLVLKPVFGYGGDGFMRCRWTDEGVQVNGTRMDVPSFESLVADLDDYLVCEFVQQADYADDLFPDAANTVRLISMWDDEREEAYVPIVIHRIGTAESAPTDHAGGGGLSAEIDRESGVLGPAARLSESSGNTLRWYANHPDTGARIEGTQVPGWEDVISGIEKLAASFSYIPYIGWDLLVTDDGEFTVLETNTNTDVRSLQIHRPLLADSRARRFYRRHGIV